MQQFFGSLFLLKGTIIYSFVSDVRKAFGVCVFCFFLSFLQKKRKTLSRIYFKLFMYRCSSFVLHIYLFFWTVNLLIRMKIKGNIVIIKIFYVFPYHLLWELEHGPQMYTGISLLCQRNMEKLNRISSLSLKASPKVRICCTSVLPFLSFLHFFLFYLFSILCFALWNVHF